MERKNNKNKADDNSTEDLAKSQSFEEKGPNLLKAKSDIAKSMAKNFLKTRKATGTSDVRKRKQKKKNNSVSEGSKETEENAQKLGSREETQQIASTSMEHVERIQQIRKNQDTTTSTEHVDKSQQAQQSQDNPASTENVEKSRQIQKNRDNTHASDSQEKSGKPNDYPKKHRRERKPGVSNKSRNNEEKQKGKAKAIKQNERKEEHNNSEKNKNKELRHGKEKKQENEKKEKIDGLIFMCNAKTKPDCFRYRVMGVSTNKKDIVLGIKPGLKLFLYDYDLKLMYGIYKASSSGRMKLEPKAFGGAFPAQVRFSVHADCFPLAETIFKKAIKENYNEKNKFKTELTARQVRKLTELFRPVAVNSTALHVRSPSRPVGRNPVYHENREARDRAREARPPSDREAAGRDPYANTNARSYAVLSHDRDRRIAYRELVSTRRDDIRHDLYLSEKEYRTHGLQGERRNLTLEHHVAPSLGTYRRDYEEQLRRQPDPVYRESLPIQREIIRLDPLYLTEREFRTYDLGATEEMQSIVPAATTNTPLASAPALDSYAMDSFYSRYYDASLVESYLPRPRGQANLIEANPLRRENSQVGEMYPAYASNALADYNQMHRQIAKPEAASTSVSSQYSFPGATFSYR